MLAVGGQPPAFQAPHFDAAGVRQDPVAQAIAGHFQAEQQRAGPLARRAFGERQSARGLSHRRTSREDGQLSLLHPAGDRI